jgi:hypothetical protein
LLENPIDRKEKKVFNRIYELIGRLWEEGGAEEGMKEGKRSIGILHRSSSFPLRKLRELPVYAIQSVPDDMNGERSAEKAGESH